MARDNELDRLKAAQDQAFRRKQDAYQAMQAAWEKFSSARDKMNRAFEAKQSAYAEQDETWQALKRLQDEYGPQIDSLNAQQERAYQSMKSSFESASSAYESGNGASAKTYSLEGHRYKDECTTCVAERRKLVSKLKSAQAVHNSTKPAFQRAKEDFNSAKRSFDSAKAEHGKARDAFKRAKADFDTSVSAFRARLDKVRAEAKKRREHRQALARKAGVPSQYLDNVWVSEKPDGTVNIYFGGLGEPNGPGHGHYVLDRNSNVTYKRDPFDPRGSENFQKADDAALLYIRSARRDHSPLGTNEHGGVFYRRSDTGGTILHITQYFDDGYRVSWDATPLGNRNMHWTNQRLHESDPDRHTPPPDAAL